VYVAPVDQSSAPRRVYEGVGHYEAVTFSPDASQLVVQHERSNFDNDLHLVNLASTSVPPRETLLTQHQGGERFYYARFARGGRSLLLATDRGHDMLTVSRMELDGTAGRAHRDARRRAPRRGLDGSPLQTARPSRWPTTSTDGRTCASTT
jgi:Tol biopolymer transport system component